MSAVRLGARGSRLSRVQCDIVIDALRRAHPGLEVEFVAVQTRGDSDRSTPLAEGSGWFTTAIQEALLAGQIDLAVHSYKDLPTRRPEGLTLAAVPAREDPRDALVSREGKTLRDLPPGARVGTSSPRRSAQALAVNPGLRVESIRGNVETRVRKVMEGEYDAAILAYAGLLRLGLEPAASQVFGIEELLPAPAQGALAVECRSDNSAMRELAASIHNRELGAIVSSERAFLARLEAGCSFPAAAYAEVFGTTVKLHALVASGREIFRSKIGGPLDAAAGLGTSLAEELMKLAGMQV